MSTALEIRPQLGEPELAEDEPKVAHLVSKEDWMRGYLLGEPVTALCGHTWVPTRDPERYPNCQPCVDIHRMLGSSPSN